MRPTTVKAVVSMLVLTSAVLALIACSNGGRGGRSRPAPNTGVSRPDRFRDSSRDLRNRGEGREGEERLRGSDRPARGSYDGRIVIEDIPLAGPPMITSTQTSPSGFPPGSTTQPTTGAIYRDNGVERRYIDIHNDGVLPRLKQMMNQEPDDFIREKSKELAANIRHVGVYASREHNLAIVRVAFADEPGEPLTHVILDGTLAGGVSQMRQKSNSNPNFWLDATLRCLEDSCANVRVELRQWRERDGQLQLCKRVHLIHRFGDARITVDGESDRKFRNGQITSHAFGAFMEFLINTVSINEHFTRTGQLPDPRTPFASSLNLRTWTVPYGASEYVLFFKQDWGLEGLRQASEGEKFGFRGFLYKDVDYRQGGGGNLLVEFGDVNSEQYRQAHQLLVRPGGYSDLFQCVYQLYNDTNGNITLDVRYKGDPSRTVLGFESLLPRVEPVVLTRPEALPDANTPAQEVAPNDPVRANDPARGANDPARGANDPAASADSERGVIR